jgi:hypothetical protein
LGDVEDETLELIERIGRKGGLSSAVERGAWRSARQRRMYRTVRLWRLSHRWGADRPAGGASRSEQIAQKFRPIGAALLLPAFVHTLAPALAIDAVANAAKL